MKNIEFNTGPQLAMAGGPKIHGNYADEIDNYINKIEPTPVQKNYNETVGKGRSNTGESAEIANKNIENIDKGVSNPHDNNYSTEEWYNYLKEKYGEDNVYLCTDEKALINSVSEKLENYRKNIDGDVYAKTAAAYGENLDSVSIATSNSHEYNPTILTDAETFNKDKFNKIFEECNGKESDAYSKYYEHTLTQDYIKNSLPDEYFTSKGLVKDDVISEMKKLTDAIAETKNQAKTAGSFGEYSKEASFEKWNVENCAEVWSVRKAILNGAKFDDISFKCVQTKTGKYAKPCLNCEITFEKLNNVGKVK